MTIPAKDLAKELDERCLKRFGKTFEQIQEEIDELDFTKQLMFDDYLQGAAGEIDAVCARSGDEAALDRLVEVVGEALDLVRGSDGSGSGGLDLLRKSLS